MASTPNDPPPADQEALSDECLPLTELESISARPPSWRKRAAQLALLALALCVGLVAIWSAIVPSQRQAAQPAAAPIPISALLVSNLTNATITLNGKNLNGHPPMVVSAYLQTDEITISAPLFHAHTCHFNGLVTKQDAAHCLFTLNSVTEVSAQYIIGVYLTPDDLLPAQKNQVVAPIMQQLAIAQQTTTQPGDYIATTAQNDSITSLLTTTPLQASATFVQAQHLASAFPNYAYPFSPACAQQICPLGFGPPSSQVPAGQVWGLVLNVMLRWRFTDSAGATIADVTYQPESGTPVFGAALPKIQFAYGTTGWSQTADTNLSDELSNTLCSDGLAILQLHLLSASFSYGIQMGTNRGAEGCLISLQSNEKGNSTFLWRFGVLLAADAGAHAILPDLPIASPAAIAAGSG